MSAMSNTKKRTCSHTGRVDYVLANIYLTYIVGYLILLAERKLGMATDHKDVIRAVLCMCVSCLICILASAWRTEKKSDILLNVVVSSELFFVALHMKDGKILSILPIALLIGVSILTAICFSIFLQSDKGICKQSFKNRCRQLFVIERFFTAAFCPVVLLIVCSQVFVLPRKINESNKAVSEQIVEIIIENTLESETTETVTYDPHPVYGDEYMMSNNLERIKPIAYSEEWEDLTLEQRQDTMKAVTECELRYLGIPFTVEIKFVDMEEDKNTLAGYYSRSKHRITFNNYALKEQSNEENLKTALHEVRHAYQDCMCNIYKHLSDEEKALYTFYGVDNWCRDLENYGENSQDEASYYSLSLERDARSYAKEEAEVYISEIKKRLGDQ